MKEMTVVESSSDTGVKITLKINSGHTQVALMRPLGDFTR